MIPQRIIDHGSRRVLTIGILGEKSSIALLRLLLHAIKHYGKPRKIRTGNEAVFTSWGFAFALRWLGIRHERIKPESPSMNGCIEWVWLTFKQLLRMFDIRNEAELQATLELLRDTYQPASSESVAQRAYAHRSLGYSGKTQVKAPKADAATITIPASTTSSQTIGQPQSANPLVQTTKNRRKWRKKFTTQGCENPHGTHRKLQLSERNSSRKLMLMFSDSGRRPLSLSLIFFDARPRRRTGGLCPGRGRGRGMKRTRRLRELPDVDEVSPLAPIGHVPTR